jgi:hypothetical protein
MTTKLKAGATEQAGDENAETVTAAVHVATKEVRVIADHGEYKVNDVAAVPVEAVRGAVADGWADDSPAAVAYAKSITAN